MVNRALVTLLPTLAFGVPQLLQIVGTHTINLLGTPVAQTEANTACGNQYAGSTALRPIPDYTETRSMSKFTDAADSLLSEFLFSEFFKGVGTGTPFPSVASGSEYNFVLVAGSTPGSTPQCGKATITAGTGGNPGSTAFSSITCADQLVGLCVKEKCDVHQLAANTKWENTCSYVEGEPCKAVCSDSFVATPPTVSEQAFQCAEDGSMSTSGATLSCVAAVPEKCAADASGLPTGDGDVTTLCTTGEVALDATCTVSCATTHHGASIDYKCINESATKKFAVNTETDVLLCTPKILATADLTISGLPTGSTATSLQANPILKDDLETAIKAAIVAESALTPTEFSVGGLTISAMAAARRQLSEASQVVSVSYEVSITASGKHATQKAAVIGMLSATGTGAAAFATQLKTQMNTAFAVTGRSGFTAEAAVQTNAAKEGGAAATTPTTTPSTSSLSSPVFSVMTIVFAFVLSLF